jgi:hypothetical protein
MVGEQNQINIFQAFSGYLLLSAWHLLAEFKPGAQRYLSKIAGLHLLGQF